MFFTLKISDYMVNVKNIERRSFHIISAEKHLPRLSKCCYSTCRVSINYAKLPPLKNIIISFYKKGSWNLPRAFYHFDFKKTYTSFFLLIRIIPAAASKAKIAAGSETGVFDLGGGGVLRLVCGVTSRPCLS